MPRTGEIGEQIFEQVEKLVATGMNRTEAFAKISEESGRRAGTVAANYYRVARKRAGGSLRAAKKTTAASRKRGARSGRAAATRGRAVARSADAEIDALAASMVKSIQALTEAVKAQSRDVQDLRKRLDGVKKLLG